MASTPTTPAAPNWGRWSQPQPQQQQEQRPPQQQSPHFVMMDTPGMVSYDARHVTTTNLQRPVMAPQYVVGNSYNESHMNSVPASSYGGEVPYGYQPRPSITCSPKHPPTPERSPACVPGHLTAQSSCRITTPPDRQACLDGKESSQVPFAQSLSLPKPAGAEKTSRRKAIPLNVDVNGELQVVHNTAVDNLMRSVQSAKKTADKQRGVKISPHSEEGRKAPAKKFVCDICRRSYSGRGSLNIHRRSHTGDKPYKCAWPGCDHASTQLGNCKTHYRKHTQERPYQCDQCDAKFPQNGNLTSHKKTHLGVKEYRCTVAGCGTLASTRGNLKQHINRAHKESADDLREYFDQLSRKESISNEDILLIELLMETFPGTNKGIRGRGQRKRSSEITPPNTNRTTPLSPSSPDSTANSMDSQDSQQQYSHNHQQPFALHMAQIPVTVPRQPQAYNGFHYAGISHPAAYSSSRAGAPAQHVFVNVPMSAHSMAMPGVHQYNVFDSSGSNSTNEPSPNELGFGGRMY